MIIDNTETKRLLASISREELQQAMELPVMELTKSDNGGSDVYASASCYVAGQISARLEALRNGNKAGLPTVDEVATESLSGTDSLKKKLAAMTADQLEEYLVNLCWRSYRYGYYQGRDDYQDFMPEK